MKRFLNTGDIGQTANKTEATVSCPSSEHTLAVTSRILHQNTKPEIDESEWSTQIIDAFVSYYPSKIYRECELSFLIDSVDGEARADNYPFEIYL